MVKPLQMTYPFIAHLVCLALQNIITCQIKLQFKYPEISILVSTWLFDVKFANFGRFANLLAISWFCFSDCHTNAFGPSHRLDLIIGGNCIKG